jgi:hypothetical protein
LYFEILKNMQSGLARLLRVLVKELTYLVSKFRFDMYITFMTNYFFSDSDVTSIAKRSE